MCGCSRQLGSRRSGVQRGTSQLPCAVCARSQALLEVADFLSHLGALQRNLPSRRDTARIPAATVSNAQTARAATDGHLCPAPHRKQQARAVLAASRAASPYLDHVR